MPTLTIFTPAYNREQTLPRLYESLKTQQNKDFLWLVIDDGSTDGTGELVKGWQEKETDFAIEYRYKENGGVHTAHNLAYEIIQTTLCMCVDSDDIVADNAISLILGEWEKIKDENLAGLVGLEADFEGKIIGTDFPEDMKRTALNAYFEAGGLGEKKLVYRTDVIRSVPPYPVFKGEKYMELNYKYFLVDQNYELHVVNKPFCNVEYQSGQSGDSMAYQYLKNPKGFACLRKMYMEHDKTKKKQFIDCIHYVSASHLAADPDYMKKSPNKFMTFCAVPFAWSFTKFLKNIENDDRIQEARAAQEKREKENRKR